MDTETTNFWIRFALVLGPIFEPSLELTFGGTDPPQRTQGTDIAKKGVPKWTPFWTKVRNKLMSAALKCRSVAQF